MSMHVEPSSAPDNRHAPLLMEARNGSHSAIGHLLQNCREYLLLVANRELPPDIRQKFAASDLVQETLLDGVEGFERFAGKTSEELLAWLSRILENNLADAIRRYRLAEKRDVRREVSIDIASSPPHVLEKLVIDDESIGQRVIRAEQWDLLSASLNRLADNDRQVIMLRNLEYRPFAEIAETMQISVSSAEKLWQRAVRRLANELRSDDASRQ